MMMRKGLWQQEVNFETVIFILWFFCVLVEANSPIIKEASECAFKGGCGMGSRNGRGLVGCGASVFSTPKPCQKLHLKLDHLIHHTTLSKLPMYLLTSSQLGTNNFTFITRTNYYLVHNFFLLYINTYLFLIRFFWKIFFQQT